MPIRDYTLKTPEEKLVIYADRIVDTYTEELADVDEKAAENRFEDILKQFIKHGKNETTTERYIKLHQEIRHWMNE